MPLEQNVRLSRQAFLECFATKAASLGVNPFKLIKQASALYMQSTPEGSAAALTPVNGTEQNNQKSDMNNLVHKGLMGAAVGGGLGALYRGVSPDMGGTPIGSMLEGGLYGGALGMIPGLGYGLLQNTLGK